MKAKIKNAPHRAQIKNKNAPRRAKLQNKFGSMSNIGETR